MTGTGRVSLVTGGARGIGRAIVADLAARGDRVAATYRGERPADADDGVLWVRCDVTDPDAVDAAFREVEEMFGPVEVLVSNAGIGRDIRRLGEIDYGYVQRMLAVNTIGPLKLVETFRPNLAAGRERRLLIVTSAMGAIGANLSGGHYGYRASKAGLNAIGRSLAIDLFADGITVAMLHPGWVRTAGGSDDAPLTATESVAAMRDFVRRLGNHQTGGFYTYAGQPLPW